MERGRGRGRGSGYGGEGRGDRGCGGEGRGSRGYGGEVRGGGGYGGGRGRGARSGGDHRWNNNRDGGGYVGSDHRDRYEYAVEQPRDSSWNNIGGGGGDRYENREKQPRDWWINQSGGGRVRGGGRDENRSSQGRDSRRNDGGGEGNRYQSPVEQRRYSRGPDSNNHVVSPEDPSGSRGGGETQPTELHQRVVPFPPAQTWKGPSDFRVGMQMSKDWKQLSPLQRPDRGGSSSIRNVKLHINHFLVKYNPETVILHYDADIKPEIPPKPGRSVKIPKSDLSMMRNKLFSNNPSEFPLSSTVYDGEKNIFSAEKLPIGKFRVEISKGEDTKTCAYLCTIKLVNKLNLSKLTGYLGGCATSIPREILQGMDVVMKENPTREMISFGHNFYHKVPNPEDDLGHGISGFRGFQSSLKTTSQGLSLCLDYSVLAFRKRLPVLEFLRQHIDGFDLEEFGRFQRRVENALEGLKVYVNHRKTSQRFVVRGLTGQSARDSSFNLEDLDCKIPPRKIFLVEYFKEKYKKTILHDNLPCLDLGKNNKKNYVPMEFCELVEGQRFLKENLDRDSAQRFKEMSLPRPSMRQEMIRNMIQSRFGPCGGEIAKNFTMDVDKNMTSVEGRVIGPPELKLGAPNERSITVIVDKEKCQWNFVGKLVVRGKPIDRWAVLDFRQNDRGFNRFDLDHNAFIPKLIARCDKLGIRMAQPLLYEPTSMRKLSSVDNLCEILEGISQHGQKKGGGRLQLLVCIMARRDPGYKYLKWISEIKIGIVTQCCLSSLANKANDQYLANLGMKINAKLGGSNVELNRVPISTGAGHVMFVGADVNHPTARNEMIHSIAAVVGTLNWPAANRYAARVRAQPHRCERIRDFGNMCLALIESYARQNKVRPDSIVIFRDGVSDGQFDMVLNEEFLDLKRALDTINYSPVITIVVAQKRHQTRLFPQTNKDGSSTGNVPPGTVVDTKIVHPFEFDFYLCSHYGSLGTSKPTHYHVLYDEHGFTSDQLQKLIFDMCFTMARCTKPVSLVPPVYYADLVAYRGRLYHEAMIDGQSPQSVGSSSSSLALLDERFFKLHPELEDEMFFI